MRYSNTGKNKENGVVYTPEEMANYVAKEILNYRTSAFDSEISILDPAVGTGELLIALINTISEQGKRIKAVGYETDKIVGKETQKKLEIMFPQVEIEIRTSNFLDAVEDGTAGKYDCDISGDPAAYGLPVCYTGLGGRAAADGMRFWYLRRTLLRWNVLAAHPPGV